MFFCFFTSDVESTSGKQLCGGNRTAIEKMLQFGRELQAMSQHLRRQFGHSDTNKKAIQVLTAALWWVLDSLQVDARH